MGDGLDQLVRSTGPFDEGVGVESGQRVGVGAELVEALAQQQHQHRDGVLPGLRVVARDVVRAVPEGLAYAPPDFEVDVVEVAGLGRFAGFSEEGVGAVVSGSGSYEGFEQFLAQPAFGALTVVGDRVVRAD